jgi:hypothetical protein
MPTAYDNKRWGEEKKGNKVKGKRKCKGRMVKGKLWKSSAGICFRPSWGAAFPEEIRFNR